MSSQDGSNRSQRDRRTPRQQRPSDAAQRQNQRWDVDPAEIDRYLSGRPTRAEDSARRPAQRSTSGNTADQLSQLQNAVGRRPARPENESTETYRTPATQRQRPQSRPQPEPVADYADDEYDDYVDESVGSGYADDRAGYEYDDVAWEEPAPVRQPRQRQAAPQRAARQPRRYEQPPAELYDDHDYEDELYNDDPYLGYEDEQLDRRPPRAQRPRQQVKISKPNLPKVTIPSSISESPLLVDRPALIMIGIALLSVALMAFVVSDRINMLGDVIPTHVSASGDPEEMRTREAVWNIPLLAGMVMLMNVAASWFISRIDQFAARFLMAAGLLVHFVAWVALFKYLWE